MITITDDMIKDAREKMAKGTPEAVGYRLMVYAIEAIQGLEDAEVDKYETLAAAGFVSKTNDQTERESKGSHYGILVNMGDHAFKGDDLGGKPWVEEGDLLIFDRYAGVTIEIPPGSGQNFRFTNDESVLGRMK